MTVPAWVEDMRKARVPHADGMSWARGDGSALLAKATRPRHNEDEALSAAHFGWVPDLDDRATFLLCCDEAERRGVKRLSNAGGRVGVTPVDLPLRSCTAVGLWREGVGDELRLLLAAALGASS